ncbi:MAG: NCS2 family permease [Actinobacteria bacterium]|nr:NCS2 family permease [Actinomycetota bacterium]
MPETTTKTGSSGLDRYFKITERGSNVRTEVIAGFTTFMTMAYILFVNPSILGAIPDRNGTTLAFPLVLTVTALAAGVNTLAMGLYARYPFAIAAGLGLNAVVAFQLVGGNLLTWPEAMGVIVLEGIIITILVLTGFREAVMNAIPLPLKQAIGVGIGLFIAIIGFVNGGFASMSGVETAPLTLGTGGELHGWKVTIFVIGLLFTAFLVARKVKGALLIGILATTVFSVVVNEFLWAGTLYTEPGVARLPSDVISLPDFSLVGQVDLFGSFVQMGAIAAVLAVFTIMLADFFDTMGTIIGLGGEAGFLDRDGRLPGTRRVLLVDSMAAAVGGLFSASSNTTYIESASGISEGGRTGLTSVVVGVLFLAALALSPLAGVIPPQATAPALVIVGFLMMSLVREIPWDDYETSIPAFLMMVVMPFTYSITNGIGAGFISYVAIKLLRGKGGEVHWMMYVSALAFLVYFAITGVRVLLGLQG